MLNRHLWISEFSSKTVLVCQSMWLYHLGVSWYVLVVKEHVNSGQDKWLHGKDKSKICLLNFLCENLEWLHGGYSIFICIIQLSSKHVECIGYFKEHYGSNISRYPILHPSLPPENELHYCEMSVSFFFLKTEQC